MFKCLARLLGTKAYGFTNTFMATHLACPLEGVWQQKMRANGGWPFWRWRSEVCRYERVRNASGLSRLELLFVPVHHDGHWMLIVVLLKRRSIVAFDSVHERGVSQSAYSGHLVFIMNRLRAHLNWIHEGIMIALAHYGRFFLRELSLKPVTTNLFHTTTYIHAYMN